MESLKRLAPVQQQRAPLRSKIISALRNAIEVGILEPGTRLVEKDLCEQLDVSRTSLREALRELQAEGIFEQTSNRGLTVSAISFEDASNVYRIRAMLEALIVEQFIEKADDAAIRAVSDEGEALKLAYQGGLVDEIVRAKRSFYDRICAGAENGVAFDILNRLVLRTSSLRRRSLVREERQRQSIKEIDRLLRAIQRRNQEAARQAAIQHVNNSAKSALNGLPGSEAAGVGIGRKRS